MSWQQRKIVILAVWLGVNAAWLRFGGEQLGKIDNDIFSEATISTLALALLNDIMSLPEPAQKTIRAIIDAFLLNFPHNSPGPKAFQTSSGMAISRQPALSLASPIFVARAGLRSRHESLIKIGLPGHFKQAQEVKKEVRA